jgi:hypothetical protein
MGVGGTEARLYQDHDSGRRLETVSEFLKLATICGVICELPNISALLEAPLHEKFGRPQS